MKKLITVLIVLIFGFTAAELKAQKIECFILKAPEKPFYHIKKIGVLRFDCTNNRRKSEVVTNTVIADLLDRQRGIYNKTQLFGLGKVKEGRTYLKGVQTDFYDVVEREQLDKILREHRLSLSGAIDESSAAEVGKILGLDAIIMGNVHYIAKDERTTIMKNPCLQRKVIASGSMKIISVQTAKIEGSKNFTVEYKKSACGSSTSGLPSREEMADVALKGLAHRFVNYFTPGYQHTEFDLEKIKLKAYREKSKEMVDFLESGDIQRAFPIAYAVFEADSYNPKAAYNLGVIYEMVGDYEEASHYYDIAYELDYNNEKFQKAAERAKKGIALMAFLKDVGRPVQPYNFSGKAISTALADKVTIKGSSADRTPVFELPDKASNIIARIPGGLEFKVVQKQSDFYKIQLRGNKTGFVHQSDVK
ncbi:MAG: hypothetical protein JXR71_01405 [Bacteroidales bacterium]|nr:hypothetical protein [Bacteroidales bacterium]